MKRIAALIALLCFFHNISAQRTDSLLVVLEKEMANRETYVAVREQRIKQLKQYLGEPNMPDAEAWNFNSRLAKEYIPYQLDSAITCLGANIRLAEKMHNVALLYEARIQLADVLSSSGNYTEAGDALALIDRRKLPGNLLKKYHYAQMWLNYRLRFYSPLEETKQKYTRLYHAYADSLTTGLDASSELYLSVAETRYREQGEFARARETNLQRLAMAQPATRTYSSIAFFLAQSYLAGKDIDSYKKYLTLSAISDIRAAVKDNASLTALAVQLFKEGDIDRAHNYINFAFEDAAFYNSRLRSVSISNVLPIINKTYETEIQAQKEKLKGYLIVITIMAVLLVFTVFYIVRQLKSLSRARKNLQEANASLSELNIRLQAANTELGGLYGELSETNRVKEYYIGNLLNLCSEYLDKLDTYRKTVKKMIVAKQVAELFERTKSSQLIDEELEVFYKNFDTIFLHIYPDFVECFNGLLMPEERIVLKKGELLTTELRIFALIRLGITDSSGIAKLLRYSVNTIYNYRVKTKNKAAGPRDDLEAKVMQIGSFKNR